MLNQERRKRLQSLINRDGEKNVLQSFLQIHDMLSAFDLIHVYDLAYMGRAELVEYLFRKKMNWYLSCYFLKKLDLCPSSFEFPDISDLMIAADPEIIETCYEFPDYKESLVSFGFIEDCILGYEIAEQEINFLKEIKEEWREIALAYLEEIEYGEDSTIRIFCHEKLGYIISEAKHSKSQLVRKLAHIVQEYITYQIEGFVAMELLGDGSAIFITHVWEEEWISEGISSVPSVAVIGATIMLLDVVLSNADSREEGEHEDK